MNSEKCEEIAPAGAAGAQEADRLAIERQGIWHEYRTAKLLVATQMLRKISDMIENLDKNSTLVSFETLTNCIRTLSEVS